MNLSFSLLAGVIFGVGLIVSGMLLFEQIERKRAKRQAS
jgi:hypothetical protein